jgi:RNA polymerase sigma-70 factor (ECF subfamily)
VDAQDGLAARFETHRDHLRTVAYRMLGSLSEAEDSVQEAWLRLARVDADGVENLTGWLTTAVSRICLDMLRSRASRREELAGHPMSEEGAALGAGADPEQEALLAESVGRALLVVLDRLGPAERVALVLHDVFAVPFDQIAPVVGRSTATTKKLASRARGKVRGTAAISGPELARQRRVIEAFLAASRAGDIDAVLAVLAPDVVRRADRSAVPAGRPSEVRGAQAVAQEIAVFGKSAHFAEPALVNGSAGIVVAPHGRLQLALAVTIARERITGYELIAAPDRLRQLHLAVLDGPYGDHREGE